MRKETRSFGTFDQILARLRFGLPEFNVGIEPFTVQDVQAAVAANQVDDRAHQSPELQAAYDAERSKGADHVKAWMREYHIRRTAYFVTNGWAGPLTLDAAGWIRDGAHRLLAAAVRGDEFVDCSQP
jgi:hypothetical protein